MYLRLRTFQLNLPVKSQGENRRKIGICQSLRNLQDLQQLMAWVAELGAIMSTLRFVIFANPNIPLSALRAATDNSLQINNSFYLAELIKTCRCTGTSSRENVFTQCFCYHQLSSCSIVWKSSVTCLKQVLIGTAKIVAASPAESAIEIYQFCTGEGLIIRCISLL